MEGSRLELIQGNEENRIYPSKDSRERSKNYTVIYEGGNNKKYFKVITDKQEVRQVIIDDHCDCKNDVYRNKSPCACRIAVYRALIAYGKRCLNERVK